MAPMIDVRAFTTRDVSTVGSRISTIATHRPVRRTEITMMAVNPNTISSTTDRLANTV